MLSESKRCCLLHDRHRWRECVFVGVFAKEKKKKDGKEGYRKDALVLISR